jgi:L-ascorbate metabolism protein UlaG (beta-lactamase superfamily)
MRALLIAIMLAGATSLEAQELTLTYLGNMGVLLESGGRRIVIDGLHRGGLAAYAAVPPQLLSPLEQARPPFDHLTAALTTHRHLDHFDRASVWTRLQADTLIVYGAATEVMDSVGLGGPVPRPARLRTVRVGGRTETEIAPGIIALDLPHNRTRSKAAENVGYLVEIGGLKVLHAGDADPTAANYAPYRLPARRIDIAIVPYWYLTSDDDAVRKAIGARRWVASHVQFSDSGEVRRDVLKRIPGAVVLTRPGEQITLR